ncbi:putative membrane protein DUF2207 [Luteococcus japonicus]|uniref:DUF2207 domain-containing protein n=3 Tax=Luteococcus TaxID=33983 RepID=A0A1R4JTX8_9ACTN|nr:DUF2207 domain-containing protein [Luteococcus japonicus]ROR56001.1 putative membrane protein DUF2207 [Luteococcus japonicus]SJN35721.1 hypothetical protein FM114_09700 [Luteococcus japonicus LSP_Lj1]
MTGRMKAGLLGLMALLLGVLGASAPSAAWAAGDTVDSWKINYTVKADGTVHAKETLVYRFGTSGRQGIARSFVTREAFDEHSDAVYEVKNFSVTASDGASGQVTPQYQEDGRDEFLSMRIGTQGRYIQTRTVTYTLEYDVKGAMRTSGDYDEFYWDALSGETPLVRDIDVTVTVPGGVKGVRCYSGPAQTKNPCTSMRVNAQRGEYHQDAKQAGDVLSIGAKIAAGQVSDNAPHLVTRADAETIAMQRTAMGAGVVSLVLSPLLGLLYYRRRGRDLRYVGLPPGVVPGPGEKGTQKPTGPIEIPVAFSPPRISVAEAGLLVDGVIDTKETTATLVDLAVRGAVKIANDDGSTRVALVDASVATAPHEQVLLQRLFAGRSGEVELSGRGDMYRAHTALVTSVRNQLASARVFTSLPSAATTGFGCSGVLLMGFVAYFFFGASSGLLWLAVPLIPIALTYMVLRKKMRRGRRTGYGRALTDQVEGFRTYIATAEADQLKFEEGEDIFSRYLPWAILFGLADRWADVCAELVRMGRLSAEPPMWYYGPYDHWNFYVFNNSLNTIDHAAAPEVTVPSSFGTSGSGFGGGSSFGGGGGFSGGGGGGGGVGSW